jgi:hypothetical protein
VPMFVALLMSAALFVNAAGLLAPSRGAVRLKFNLTNRYGNGCDVVSSFNVRVSAITRAVSTISPAASRSTLESGPTD